MSGALPALVLLGAISSGSAIDDCRIVDFPAAPGSLLELARMREMRSELDNELEIAGDVASDHGTLTTWGEDVGWGVLVAEAKEALARSEDEQLATAISSLSELAASDRIPQHGWYDLLALHVWTVDSALPSVSVELLLKAAKFVSAEVDTYRDPRATVARMAIASVMLASGNDSLVNAEIDSIDPESKSITDQYVLGYLGYRVASEKLDVLGLESAIRHLDSVVSDERIGSCNPALAGVAYTLQGSAYLLIAQALSKQRPQLNDQETRTLEMLVVAQDRVESGRRHLDPLYVPGLWSWSLWISVDVYSALAALATEGHGIQDKVDTYRLLAEASRRLASSY